MKQGLNAELDCTIWANEADAKEDAQKLLRMAAVMRTHAQLPNGLRRVEIADTMPCHGVPPRYRPGLPGLSVFQLAVLARDLRVVRLLLDLKADPNFRCVLFLLRSRCVSLRPRMFPSACISCSGIKVTKEFCAIDGVHKQRSARSTGLKRAFFSLISVASVRCK
jgi:hypothetical protein